MPDKLDYFNYDSNSLSEEEIEDVFREYIDKTDAWHNGTHSDYKYQVEEVNNHYEVFEIISLNGGLKVNKAVLEDGNIEEEKDIELEETGKLLS